MKAIIFDFDGVLADTYDYNKDLCKLVGHDVDHEDFMAHHDGNVFEKPKIIFTPQSSANYGYRYHKDINDVKPFYTPENIRLLKDKYELHIISSSHKDSIQKFLKHNNLEYFTEVLGVDFHKSKVAKFNYLFEKYDLQPHEVVFVTDTLGDILEGHSINVKAIAVDHGFHDKERLERGKPFQVVSSFNEIVSVIDDMDNG